MKILFRLILIGLIIGILGTCGVAIYLYQVNENLPKIESLADYQPPVSSSIYSRDGELLLEIAKEKRLIASFVEIPQRVVNCFLAAEDDSFYQHSGVDYMGIFRSAIKNVLAGRVVQGGSTITQQVAKTFFTTGERTISRKVKDMLLARKIEQNFSKSEILYLYLNQMYFGGGYYGIKMAAKGYYNKELQDVTIAEAALLAGLLARPHGYSPYVGPVYAKRRQRYVLRRLFDTGKITELEYEAALLEELKIHPRENSLKKAGYFVDWVKSQVLKKIPEQELMTQGYEIITSLDWSYQQKAEKSVIAGLKKIDKRQGYKGVLDSIIEESEAQKFYKEQREEKFSEVEGYKSLTVTGEMRSEYNFATVEEEDAAFYKLIELEDSYKAIVTEVDDEQKVIRAKISDTIHVGITFDNFKWAKKRLINPKKTQREDVEKASDVVKLGDVILVSLLKDISTEGDEGQFKYLASLDQDPEVQGALLALEVQTGEVLAMVGGKSYQESQFNRVTQSKRQPGSIFKSLYYAAALEKGYTPASVVMDTPYALSGGENRLSWKPKNYDKRYLGPMTFRTSLEKSRNIPSIKIAQDVGVSNFRRFLNRFGLNLKIPNDLSFSLGAFEIKLIDLVKGYSVFASQGKKIPMRSILLVRKTNENENFEDFDIDPSTNNSSDDEVFDDAYISLYVDTDILVGDFEFYDTSESGYSRSSQLYQKRLSGDQVYDERLAYIMTNLLKGVVRNGTGRRARKAGSFLAGKTGTTNDYIDAWFVGYSKNVVAGVWTGFDVNKSMGYGEGGGISAAPLWADFMKFTTQTKGEKDFKTPNGVINVKINRETGKLAQVDEQRYFMETFVQGTEPSFEEGGVFEGTSDANDDGSDDDFYLNQ